MMRRELLGRPRFDLELLDLRPTKKLGQNFVIDAQHRAPHRASRRRASGGQPSSRSARGSARSRSA